MAEKGLFFNAFPSDEYETGYDRNYSADDISDMLSVFGDTGVVKTNNEAGTGIPLGLKVNAGQGLSVAVNIGKAIIRGKGYINNTALTLAVETAPTGSSPRYDYIVLRMDNTQSVSARKTYLAYVKGGDSIPTASDLTRTDDIFELMLAYIAVKPNATSIQQADINDTRGDKSLCPWFTAVKGYDDYYDAIVQQFQSNVTMPSAGRNVITDLASSLFNEKYSIVDVYCNGLKEEDDAYSISVDGNFIAIEFASQKTAGAQISVTLSNFIDGEGLSTAISQYNEWVNDVATIKQAFEFNYLCNGVDDNVRISNIVKTFMDGAGDFYKTLKINVIGNFGFGAPVSGDGSSSSPYCLFDFGTTKNYKRFVLDFSNSGELIYQMTSGKQHIVFKGAHAKFVNMSLAITNDAVNTSVKVFADGGNWIVDSCRFIVSGYRDCILGYCGTYLNCSAKVMNKYGSSWAFFPRVNKLLSIIGGEYTAYTQDNTNDSKSALIGETTNGNVVMTNVSVPTIPISGYYQTHAIWQTNGKISSFGLVSALTISTISGASIAGTIAMSLPKQCWGEIYA